MSEYQLGQRVKISGTVQKDRSGNTVSYSDGPPPQRLNYPKPKVFTEGVIVGSRTIQDGEAWNEDEYGSQFSPKQGTARRVWLVAFDMRMKPVMCFDHQVHAFPIPESITIPAPRLTSPGFHAQSHFMRSAARNIKNDYPIGGYGVTSAVIKLLNDTADAMEVQK